LYGASNLAGGVVVLPESPEVHPDDVEPARLQAADQLGYEMVRFVRLMSRLGSHMANRQKDGVERAAYALLVHLVLEGPHRTTALAEAVHSDTSTVSRQVGALVKLGLAERRQDPADGRACLIAATGHGEEVFDHNRRRRDAHLATMLAGWPQQDFDRFVTLLGRFNTDFEGYRAVLLGTETEAEPGSGHEGDDR
jgi:DNA-binding MarR family transcriptional regulator